MATRGYRAISPRAHNARQFLPISPSVGLRLRRSFVAFVLVTLVRVYLDRQTRARARAQRGACLAPAPPPAAAHDGDVHAVLPQLVSAHCRPMRRGATLERRSASTRLSPAQRRWMLRLARFSPRSNNMLYPKEDRAAKKLMFVCKRCNYEEVATAHVVYRHELVKSAGCVGASRGGAAAAGGRRRWRTRLSACECVSSRSAFSDDCPPPAAVPTPPPFSCPTATNWSRSPTTL